MSFVRGKCKYHNCANSFFWNVATHFGLVLILEFNFDLKFLSNCYEKNSLSFWDFQKLISMNEMHLSLIFYLLYPFSSQWIDPDFFEKKQKHIFSLQTFGSLKPFELTKFCGSRLLKSKRIKEFVQKKWERKKIDRK